MAIITKELARAIAKKLKAKIVKQTGAHNIAAVYHEEKMVANFGIRRGSSRDLGHDHVPSQIFVGPKDARLLGQCPLSREDWIRIIKEKGKI
jgi:hypothetical protein